MKYIVLIFQLFIATLVTKAELSVELLTIEPGPEVYQLEGHAELRFVDPDRDLDFNVSWGVFDFDSPGFLYRFVKGETDYLAVAYPYQRFLMMNALSGRRVTSMKLNLTSDEAETLLDLVKENVKPENRVYRYNYVKDNCATRPLHLIERSIGQSLKVDDTSGFNTTWRKEMSRYHSAYPWYQFGIDLALGTGIDIPISLKETCYSPVALNDYMKKARRPDGEMLVAGSEKIVLEGNTYGQPFQPTPWYLTPFSIGFLLLVITLILSYRDFKRCKVNRFFASLLYFVSGICGLVLTYIIFVSTHEATSPNWLYLWLNPLAFVAAIGVWLKMPNRVVFYYQIVNFVALIALVVIGLTKIQHLNVAFYPFIACYMITSATYIYSYKCQTK